MPGLRTLLAHSIDYAGAFPPARLPLLQALRNYDAYRVGRDAWMLGRFVCPALRRSEWQSLIQSGGIDPMSRTPLSVVIPPIGGGQSIPGRSLPSREQLQERCVPRRLHANVHAIEVTLSTDLLQRRDPEVFDELQNSIPTLISPEEMGARTLFVELTGDPYDPEIVAWVITTLAAHSASFAFKLRTGGIERAAFPSPEQVALVISLCRDAGLCWKATAGLHQPVSRFDHDMNCWNFGFLNVFVADTFALTHNLGRPVIGHILTEQYPHAFQFEADAVRWGDLSADLIDVAKARQTGLVSFGSCSFEEPLNSLRMLELIEHTV